MPFPQDLFQLKRSRPCALCLHEIPEGGMVCPICSLDHVLPYRARFCRICVDALARWVLAQPPAQLDEIWAGNVVEGPLPTDRHTAFEKQLLEVIEATEPEAQQEMIRSEARSIVAQMDTWQLTAQGRYRDVLLQTARHILDPGARRLPIEMLIALFFDARYAMPDALERVRKRLFPG